MAVLYHMLHQFRVRFSKKYFLKHTHTTHYRLVEHIYKSQIIKDSITSYFQGIRQ